MRSITGAFALLVLLAGCSGMSSTVTRAHLSADGTGVEYAHHDPSPYDPTRCLAYEMLSDCDCSECIDKCTTKYPLPDKGTEDELEEAREKCTGKCEYRAKRALVRPVRRYGCEYDVCLNADRFERRMIVAMEHKDICEWRCNKPTEPAEGTIEWTDCMEDCADKCDVKRIHDCERQALMNCDPAERANWCNDEPDFQPCEANVD